MDNYIKIIPNALSDSHLKLMEYNLTKIKFSPTNLNMIDPHF